MTYKTEPIDAVITWVDGGDPLHKQKLEAYLREIGGVRPPSADPTRFNDAGEIDYCVASLLRFAPWIRTIYIVTDAQRPSLLQKITGTAYEGRVKIIDHLDIFQGFEHYLPTFNSSSILSVLWRIPGLSNQFLFLNDDFFVTRPVAPEDFFRNGKVVLRGSWHKHSELLWYKRLSKWWKNRKAVKSAKPKRVGFLAGQELSAKMLGFGERFFSLPHNPHAWLRDTQAEYFAKNPAVLDNNVKFRLRSAEQFIGESLAAHLEIAAGNAVIDNELRTIQIKPASQFVSELKLRLWWAEFSRRNAFMCVQSLERGCRQKQEIVTQWLDRRIGRLEQLLTSKSRETEVDTAWLSILIPCYNVEAYLEECVDSVMLQWQEGVEVILVEDCSTDNTTDKIRLLQEKYGDKLTCLQHAQNRGLSAARNTMLDQAHGTYVWFLDSDDALTPGAIAQLASVVQQQAPDLVMCDYHVWAPDAPALASRKKGLHVKTFGGESNRLLECPDQLFRGIFGEGKLHAWSKITKRSVWSEGLRFPEGKYFEDIWVAPRLALQVKSYYHYPSVWVKYRQRGGSIMASRCNKKVSDLSESLSGALALWLEKYPGLSTQARFAFTRFCAKCLRCCIKDAVSLGVQGSKLNQLRGQFYQNCQLNKWGVIKAYLNQGQFLRLRRMLRYM